MRRIVLVAVCLLAVPAGARGDGCTPLSCGPSQFLVASGRSLAVSFAPGSPVRVIDLTTGRTRWRLPGGVVTRGLVVHQDGALLTWFDAATGARVRDAVLGPRGTFVLVGTSQDARRAVLARTQRRSTTFAVVSPAGERDVSLRGGGWQFDALAGSKLFLLRTGRLGYTVRLYDLARSRLTPRPLTDPQDGPLITGMPIARASSPGGRYVFTLYVHAAGRVMVHELDVVAGTARCIDLPGSGNVSAAMTYGLAVDPDWRQVWAVSPGYGEIAAVDVPGHRVRFHYPFQAGRRTGGFTTAVVSPDGERIAFTDAQHIWFAAPALRRVVHSRPHVAIALGYSPDQRRLWVVGERSRVAGLPTR
jgi:hypothetical protein